MALFSPTNDPAHLFHVGFRFWVQGLSWASGFMLGSHDSCGHSGPPHGQCLNESCWLSSQGPVQYAAMRTRLLVILFELLQLAHNSLCLWATCRPRYA